MEEKISLNDKALLNIEQLCFYTGWGKTKVREILKRPDSPFTVRMGNRLYANKRLFDEYLNRCAKYQIEIWQQITTLQLLLSWRLRSKRVIIYV